MIRYLWHRFLVRLHTDGLFKTIFYYFRPGYLWLFVCDWLRTPIHLLESRLEKTIDGLYFTDHTSTVKPKRRLYIWYIAWGDMYLDSLFRYSLPSFLQAGNIPYLLANGYEIEVYIYSKEDDFQYLESTYQDILATTREYVPVKIIPLEGVKEKHRVEVLAKAAVNMMERCIVDDALFVNGGAEHIYGNRTIANAVRLAEGKNVCVALSQAHVYRESVLECDLLNQMSRMERSIENDELVYLAFQLGHDSIYTSFDDRDQNTTYSGLALRRGEGNQIYAVYNTPNVIVANLTQSDLRLFKKVGNFNIWDKRWLRKLCRENRLRIAGASQIGFLLQLEDKGRNTVQSKSNLMHNDKYLSKANRRLNNYVANAVCILWSIKNPYEEEGQGGDLQARDIGLFQKE